MIAAVLAGSLVAQDRSIGFAVRELPASQQAIRAVWFGTPGQSSEDRAGLDRRARAALAEITPREATALVLFRESTIAGRYLGLGAVDGLASWIDLRSGRLPRRCVPEHCEVVRLRGEGRIPNVPGLRLVEVGEATLETPVLFGDFIAPVTSGRARATLSPFLQEAARYHQPAPAPLVLADGVDGLVSSPELTSAYRSYSWVVPLEAGTVRAWNVDGFPEDVARARSSLQTQSIAFDLLAPVEELRDAHEASRAAGRRLLLIGGEAAALLFAFAVLAAVSMRRDVDAARRRLTWYGARRWQLWALVGAETVATAIVGTATGWAVGVGVSAIVASRAGVPAGELLIHSALSGTGLLVAAGVAGALAVVLVAALQMRHAGVRGLAVSPLDVAALGALGVVATVLFRGDLDQASLASEGGTEATLVLLPGLITFVAAVFFARIFRPLLLGLARLARGRAVAFRLAVVSLARHPGHAAVAIAFLVVSVGLALFAESYRTTLARGQTQQAAYGVPLDFVVREDLTRLVPVAEAVGADGFARLGQNVRVERVLRLAGNVSRSGGRTGITVLGLDPRALPALHGWRERFATASPAELAGRISAAETLAAGPVLPKETRALAVETQGRGISLVASVQNPAGDFEHLELGETSPDGRLLRAPVPERARGGRIVALTLVPPRIQERGADAGKPFAGTLALGPLLAETGGGSRAVLSGYQGWIGIDGAEPTHSGDSVKLRYTLSEQLTTRFRPRQPSDAGPVPVVASPSVAAAADSRGRLPLRIGGEQIVVRIAAVASGFPGTRGDFVVADRDLLGTAVNAARPGTAVSDEVWIGAPPDRRPEVAAALARPPFNVLSVTSRAGLERSLRHDPLARGALLTLVAGAIVALALALIGILLGVVSDLRDERGQLLDLEAQGARPATLRRIVRLRSSIITIAGVGGGVVAGAVLSRIVVDLVTVTASARAAEAPLELALDWRVLALAVAACGFLAAVFVLAATRRA